MRPHRFPHLLLLICLALFAPGLPAFAAASGEAVFETLLWPVPSWFTEGGENGVEYGKAVASAGDIDHNGYADVVIGSPKYKINDLRAGAAFVFLGGASGLSRTPHRLLSLGINGTLFGAAVASAGDVDNDGFDDVIIGAPQVHVTIGYDGAAYLYRGSAAGLIEEPAWSKTGPIGNAGFGNAVSGVGLVNDDEFADVLIGARTFSQPESNEGAVFLYPGSAAGLSADPLWSFQSNQAGAQLGYALAPLGDLNKDGFADFAVGAPTYNGTEIDQGAVFVFFGGAAGPGETPDWQALGDKANSWFGSSIASAGDVDGNGYPDLIVGASRYDTDLTDAGAAFIFLNSHAGLSQTPAWTLTGAQAYSNFGSAVAGMGDLNQDGCAEWAVGAPKITDDQSREGFVYLYRGSPDQLPSAPSWYASGNKADTDFGYAIANAGDVNGNGSSDLLVGAPIYKWDERTVMGRAFLFPGIAAGEVYLHQIHLPLVLMTEP